MSEHQNWVTDVQELLREAEVALQQAAMRFQDVEKARRGEGHIPQVAAAHEHAEVVLCRIATMRERLSASPPPPSPPEGWRPIETAPKDGMAFHIPGGDRCHWNGHGFVVPRTPAKEVKWSSADPQWWMPIPSRPVPVAIQRILDEMPDRAPAASTPEGVLEQIARDMAQKSTWGAYIYAFERESYDEFRDELKAMALVALAALQAATPAEPAEAVEEPNWLDAVPALMDALVGPAEPPEASAAR